MSTTFRTRGPRAAALVAGAALVVTLAPVASASGADPAADTAAPTVTTLAASPATAVDAGKKVRLKVRVTPRVTGIATLRDGTRQVGTTKVKEGRAKLVLVPRRGTHTYSVTFTPKNPDSYAPSTSAAVKVTAGAARSLPVAKGSFGPLVSKTQHRLTWAGVLVKATGTYDNRTVAAVKRFQGKFFLPQTGVVNERTMGQLTKVMAKKPAKACRDVSRAICIDKTRKIAQLVVNGKVKLSLDARFGSVSQPGLATREGIFSVQRKAVTHMSSEYHTSMPYSMFFSGGQAVHYSQYFAAAGYYGASHGCVNIRDYKGVAKMYAEAPLGTRVVVYRS